jgi:UDP-N-acetylmuramate--alanine ligase
MRWRDFATLPVLPDDFFQLSHGPKRVHFIGVGGIGMSALAFALRARGHDISGSDAADSPLLATLRAAGVRTVLGHQADNVLWDNTPVDAIIWGSAISEDNPERQAALQHNIPQWHRAQLLAYFVNSAKFSIAVSGTHGKSTTSAMIAHILHKCGKNPTALLGAVYPPFGSNALIGDPDLVVVEADESDGSFTLCKPTIAVVTNVEAEHLENYDESEDELWRAFKQFVYQSRTAVVLNADHAAHFKTLRQATTAQRAGVGVPDTLSYGLGEAGDLRATEIRAENGQAIWHMMYFDTSIGEFQLGVPGHYNVSNALAAISAVQPLQIAPNDAATTLSDFYGVARRFQFIGEANDILLYDDYAHHPTEVQSTLEAAREFLQRPITAIFQPHRFSRTQQMGHLFGPSFEAAERVIVTELYSAWEEPIEGVSGRIVFDAIQQEFPDKPLFFANNLEEARRLAVQMTQPGEAIFTMGAGDIGKQPPLLLQELKEKS